MKSKKDVNKSLSFALFKTQLTMDLSSYWLQISNNEYSKRWINEKLTTNQVNTTYENDNTYPFTYISLSKEDYLKKTEDFEGYISENIIMAIFSTLETYCYISLQRAIFLDSSISLNKKNTPEKSISIEKFIEIINSDNSKYEMSVFLAETLLRGKSTYQMVEFLANKYKSGVFSQFPNFCETLEKYIFVRNSIVHNNRRVSKELSNKFPEFIENRPFKLNYKNVMELSNSVMEIIKAIDKRYVEIIKKEDAKWLIREIFIQKGIDDVTEIKKTVFNTLSTIVNETEVLKALSEAKKNIELNKDFIVFSTLL